MLLLGGSGTLDRSVMLVWRIMALWRITLLRRAPLPLPFHFLRRFLVLLGRDQ